MWIMLNDAFFSIVRKDAPPGHLLVRARRPGDIEKIFGRRHKVSHDTRGDYAYRARIPEDDVIANISHELKRVDYSNFKDSVTDNDLHDAYMRVWTSMSVIQPTPPYSGAKGKKRK